MRARPRLAAACARRAPARVRAVCTGPRCAPRKSKDNYLARQRAGDGAPPSADPGSLFATAAAPRPSWAARGGRSQVGACGPLAPRRLLQRLHISAPPNHLKHTRSFLKSTSRPASLALHSTPLPCTPPRPLAPRSNTLALTPPNKPTRSQLAPGTGADSIPDDLVAAVAEALRGSEHLEVAESGFQVRAAPGRQPRAGAHVPRRADGSAAAGHGGGRVAAARIPCARPTPPSPARPDPAARAQVKRKTPLPTAGEAARAVDARSCYARPFPMDATIDGVTSYFSGAVGPVNCVRFRRHARSKDFKGSIMIEFADAETAQKVGSQTRGQTHPVKARSNTLSGAAGRRRRRLERPACTGFEPGRPSCTPTPHARPTRPLLPPKNNATPGARAAAGVRGRAPAAGGQDAVHAAEDGGAQGAWRRPGAGAGGGSEGPGWVVFFRLRWDGGRGWLRRRLGGRCASLAPAPHPCRSSPLKPPPPRLPTPQITLRMLEEADSEPEIAFLSEINEAAKAWSAAAGDKRKGGGGGGDAPAAKAARGGGGGGGKGGSGDEEMAEGGGEGGEGGGGGAPAEAAAAEEQHEPGGRWGGARAAGRQSPRAPSLPADPLMPAPLAPSGLAGGPSDPLYHCQTPPQAAWCA
jgi:hypothetical protein